MADVHGKRRQWLLSSSRKRQVQVTITPATAMRLRFVEPMLIYTMLIYTFRSCQLHFRPRYLPSTLCTYTKRTSNKPYRSLDSTRLSRHIYVRS